MIVVILAGGKGTRLAEFTKTIPKPMVLVKNKPIIHHIIDIYSNFGFKNFIIATGYKGNLIKEYFNKNKISKKLNIKTIYTGLNTMTGGRILKLKSHLKENKFLLTYGDGIANINLNKLIKFSTKHDKILTVTAVRPPARFGYLRVNKKNEVIDFNEKKQTNEGWINGGFFICKKEIFNFINNSSTFFEREPMTNLSKVKQLVAYKHNGFWQCMDTIRDHEYLNSITSKNKTYPWNEFR